MSIDGHGDETIRRLLTTTRRIALVGASPKPWRASYGVMRFLLEHGFDVTPVNPLLEGETLHGRTVVARLEDAAPLEMVDLFRNTSHAGALVDDAIRLHATAIWMQLGVIDRDAAARARAAGMTVVMDRCPVIEDRRLHLFGPPGPGTKPVSH